MITGIVLGHHALVPLTVRGPQGQEGEIEFVLDTGFAGFLTLPSVLISPFSLTYSHPMPVSLADGSRIMVDVYEAVLLWDGEERNVEVLATGREPLLGTSLLDGQEVILQFADGGLVTIEPL